MVALRRNTRWLSLGGVACVAAAGLWMAATRGSTGAISAALLFQRYPPLDEVAADRIDALRRAAGVDDDALAAVNGTSQNLETVLSGVRSWFENNAGDLSTRQAAISDKRAEIRRLESANKNGSDVIGQLNTARAASAALESAHEGYLASARTGWLGSLTQAQRDLIGVMHGNAGLAMPYRALTLSDPQKEQLNSARRRYHQRLSGTRDAAARRALRLAHDQEVASAIGAGNVQQLGTLAGYLGAASSRTTAMVNYVLPRELEE